jgi:hypothetical protein
VTPALIAESTPVTERDKENRALALELIKRSNETVTSFAKQMVTASLSAVGVILALAKFQGWEDYSYSLPRLALAASCGLCLVAAVVFALALRTRHIRVSVDDYADAPAQLLEVAHEREVLTTWGLIILSIAIVGAVFLLTLR